MLLTAPEPTPYDLRFRAFGIPVRVHPAFWIAMALLGGIGSSGVRSTLVFVAAGFVSILVHELGHGLAYRACGQWPRIVLYQMGGLAMGTEEERRPWRRLGIILAGPLAGFSLFLAAFGVANFVPGVASYSLARAILSDLLWINLVWTILNLLPIFPLDGGQAVGVLLTLQNRQRGAYRMHVVSLVVAGLGAAYFLQRANFSTFSGVFEVLLFGMLALQNYQILQYLHHHARHGNLGEDADDWWRR